MVSTHSDPCILVIGAGPAGLAAAVTAAELGLRVVLVDEAAAPGGQYLSPGDLPGEDRAGAGHRFKTKAERDGAALMARAHYTEPRSGRTPGASVGRNRVEPQP